MSSGQLAIFDQQQCAHGWWRGQWYHERKYDNVEATIATETFGNRYPTQDEHDHAENEYDNAKASEDEVYQRLGRDKRC
jgi:hypothetical protein